MREGKAVGVITIRRKNPELLTETQIELIQSFANQAAIAVENVRLFEAEQQRIAELQIINSVQEGLASNLDMPAIYTLVGETISEITGAGGVMIAKWDWETRTMRADYFQDQGKQLGPIERPLSAMHDMAFPQLERGETIVANEGIEELYREHGHEGAAGKIPKTNIAVPLKIGGKINAFISLQDTEKEYAFSQSTIQLVETLAGSMGVALENARLFDETQRLLKETEERNAELAVINSVQEGLVSNLDMQAIYDLVGDKISEITGSEIVVINTWNSKTKMIRYEYVQEKGERFDIIERPFSPLNEVNIPNLEQGETLNAQSGLEEITKVYSHTLPVGEMPRSVVTIPIRTGNEIRTSVSLQDTQQEHAFSESTIQLVETLARSMGIALENARLFEETAQRNAELAIINAVQSALAGELDLQGIFSVVGEKLHEVFHDAQVVDILTYDPETNYFTPEFVIEKGERFEVEPWHWKGFRKYIIESGKPLLINQDMEAVAEKYDNPVIVGESPKSWMGAPMMVGGEVKGVVSIQHIDRENAFRDSDLRLLTTLANSMSVALENARLFDETQNLLKETAERNAELAIINSVQEGLVAQINMQEIFDLVGDKIRDIFNAYTVMIGVFSDDGKTGSPVYLWEDGKRYYPDPTELKQGGIGETLYSTQKPMLFSGPDDWEKFGAGTIEGTENTMSAIYVPMIVGNHTRGVVSIQDLPADVFDKDDLRLLTTLTNSMSIALENARLFDETQRLLIETEERNAELAVINSVQQGMVRELNFQSIINLVGEELRNILKTDNLGIRIIDNESQMVAFPYEFEKGRRLDLPPSPLSSAPLTRNIVETKKTVRGSSEKITKELGLTLIPGTEKSKSVMAVPILVGDEVRGLVSTESFIKEDAFSDSDQRLLETLTYSMGVALENARLFDETQRLLELTEARNAELAIINSISQALTQELDLETLIDQVGDKIRLALNTENIGIGLYGKDTNLLTSMYVYKNGERVHPEPTLFNEFNRRFANQGKSLVMNDVTQKLWDKLGSNLTFGNEVPKSVVMVPILAGGELIGGITLQNFASAEAYPEPMVRLLETIASNMGTAIQNARLFEAESQRAAEFSVISKVSQALVAEPELDKMIQLIGSQATSIFNADIAYLALLNPQTNLIEFPYQFGDELEPLPFGQGLTSTIIGSGEPLILNRDLDEHSSALGVSRIGRRARSFLGVPIQSGKDTIGVLSVQSVTEEGAFDDDDLRLLTTIAANAGAGIHTAQLHAETQRRAGEMATLAEIGNDIASTRDLDTTLRKIAERAKKLLNVGDIALYLMDETGEKIVPRVVLGEYVNEIMATPISVGVGISGMVVKNGVAELVIDPSDHPNTITIPGTPEFEEEPEGMMSAPLFSGGKVIGLINVWRKHKIGLFSESELDFLVSVARQTAIAIDSARLYLETEHHAERMSTLESVGREISSDLDLQSVLERLGERALNLLKGRSVAIRLLNEEKVLLPVVALGENADKYMDHRISLGDGITGNAAQTGKAEIINQPLEDDRLKLVPGTDQVDTQALIISPLTISDSVIGTLSIWRDKSINGSFSDSDLGFAIGLARQAAIAITNANLFKEVERQKEYFEALISSAPVAIITIGLDGCVTGWSPAAENLFGYMEEEAVGANIDDLVSNHPDVREDAEKLTQHYLNDIGKIQLKSQRTHKDGHLIDVAINAMPVLIDGEVSGYIAIYNDISELEKARRDAEEANHAKSAFLANMSHELRTPLNAIIGFTRIVKRKGEKLLPDKQIENLDKVLVSAEHLLGLINTVLDISKIEAGRMEVHTSSFDLKSLINLVAATTQPLLKDGNVAFNTHVPDDLPMVNSDIEKIKQVLINLVSNAAKFTHQGEISVNLRQVKDQIEIDVADTGIGISPEAMEHIFEEFQQADSSTTREYGGTGLGLSISRSLARLLEGDLRVTSEPGVGSTFTFSFPISYGQQEEDTAPVQADQSRMGGTEPLILVIDDNEDAIYLMREMLEGAGYRVAVARDGDEGLAMAVELAPFAITLDIMMPKKDGWQVLHDLKANPVTKSIPVILISIVDQKALGYRLGAEDYLVKPLKEDEILNSLKHIKGNSGDKPLKKLLVVDDDPMVKDMISQLLEGKPYEVQSATDGLDALEKIREDKPDAILLDLMMPRLDGFGLIERLKQDPELADLPVIVLTAKLLNQKEKEALRKTAGLVIQKQGISGEQLIGEIRETIRKTV
jgi:PAS domain S-box-containing protein